MIVIVTSGWYDFKHEYKTKLGQASKTQLVDFDRLFAPVELFRQSGHDPN